MILLGNMAFFNKKKIITNASGMAAATLVQAAIKIVSVPLLLAYYDKHYFGILALSLSINLYLQFLSFGVPESLVKFISATFSEKEKLGKVCQSANAFFLVIAATNFLVLYVVATKFVDIFGLSGQDTETLSSLLVVAAFSALMYWPGAFMDSLMTSKEDLVVLSSFRSAKSLIELIGILLMYNGYFDLTLVGYFIFQCICMHMFLPVKMYRLIHLHYPIKIFFPVFSWRIFKPILMFSSAVLVIHVMNATANHLRPAIMAIQCSGNTSVVTDYRVLETIVSFALLGAGFVRTSLLPSISKAYSNGQFDAANKMVKKGSLYGWAILALPLFMGISTAPELLKIYVGQEYMFLSTPLRIWLFAVSVQLYNGPGFAAVMGGGKIRYFSYSAIISCLLSLLFLWSTASRLEIYSASFSALFLNCIHMVFLHTLILNSVPGLQARTLLFRSYIPPLFSGVTAFLACEVFMSFFELGVWITLGLKIFIICFFYLAIICFVLKDNISLKKICERRQKAFRL